MTQLNIIKTCSRNVPAIPTVWPSGDGPACRSIVCHDFNALQSSPHVETDRQTDTKTNRDTARSVLKLWCSSPPRIEKASETHLFLVGIWRRPAPPLQFVHFHGQPAIQRQWPAERGQYSRGSGRSMDCTAVQAAGRDSLTTLLATVQCD